MNCDCDKELSDEVENSKDQTQLNAKLEIKQCFWAVVRSAATQTLFKHESWNICVKTKMVQHLHLIHFTKHTNYSYAINLLRNYI